MPTQTYWTNRANQRMDQYILESERVANEITKAYYKASKRIESQMIKTIQGLSALSDSRTAIKALIQDPDAKALKSLRRAVSALPEGQEKQEALTLLSSPAYQFRIRRLQATIDNARKECERLYKVELKDTTRHLRQCYNSAFAHTIYDIDRGFNTLHTFSMFPASRVNTLLKSRWSGKNYSDRIWNSTDKLADALKEQLLVSFMSGSGVTEAAAAIREEFQSSAYAARRLVRTETNFIANQSELDAYKRLGIEEYRYIATLDTRTSDICQSLDNQVFKIDDAKAGVNLPPVHPNCRSTTIMHDAEEPLKERIAKDENGKSIYVPGNMSYSQWLQKYHPELVDKLGENGIIKDIEGDHAIGDANSSRIQKYSYERPVTKEVRKAFDEEFARAVESYGEIKAFRGVQVLNENSSDEGVYGDESHYISLRHAEKKSGLSLMASIAKEKFKNGKWSSGNPRHAMRHEIGHAIFRSKKLYDPDWDDKYNRIVELFLKAKDNEEGYALPSSYIKNDINEFVAECVAAGYSKKTTTKTVAEVTAILKEGVVNAGVTR